MFLPHVNCYISSLGWLVKLSKRRSYKPYIFMDIRISEFSQMPALVGVSWNFDKWVKGLVRHLQTKGSFGTISRKPHKSGCRFKWEKGRVLIFFWADPDASPQIHFRGIVYREPSNGHKRPHPRFLSPFNCQAKRATLFREHVPMARRDVAGPKPP